MNICRLWRAMSKAPKPGSCTSEIEQAIRELSDADWYRLRKAGEFLAWKVEALDGEGLLFEALERTLSGRRRWNHEVVDFVGHTIGVMRSIASHEAARRGFEVVALRSSMELVGLGDPESRVSAEEQIRRLRGHFDEREDHEALRVLDAMELGCDGPAIRAQLSISQRGLETIVRRIRRAAARVLPS